MDFCNSELNTYANNVFYYHSGAIGVALNMLTIVGMIGSANMDERVFSDPERFDQTRPDLTRLQMAFGAGQHGCHGQLLARAQAECAIGALVERFPNYRISGLVTHRHTEFIRNIYTLPIEFH